MSERQSGLIGRVAGRIKEKKAEIDGKLQEALKKHKGVWWDESEGLCIQPSDSDTLDKLSSDGTPPPVPPRPAKAVPEPMASCSDVDFLEGFRPSGAGLRNDMRSIPTYSEALKALDKVKANVLRREEVAEIIEMCKLTDEETEALVLYTLEEGNIYSAINKALHDYYCETDKKAIIPYMGFAYYLVSCLRKLPMYKDPSRKTCVWRGLSMPREALYNNYKEHSDVYWSGFTSTSTKLLTALGFSVFNVKEGEVPVLFRIELSAGKLISQFSQFPGEGEVLLMLNDKFFVLSTPKEHRILSFRIYVVDLVEKSENRAFRW